MGDGPAVLKGFVEGLYTWFCACTDHARKPCVHSLGSNSAHGESKLSARGVQTQHAVPPPAVHCPPTPNATCLTRSPHHCAALATFALAGRRSPSPHASLAPTPHHPAAPVALPLPPLPVLVTFPLAACRLPVALAPRLPRPLTSPSRHPRRPRRSPSPHACLPPPPHHHPALVAFTLARRRPPSP